MKKVLLLLTAAATLLAAQETPFPDNAISPVIYPPPVAAFVEVKAYLGLSDAQLEQLRQILTDRDKATQEVSQRMREKQLQIRNLLTNGSNDAAQVGRLTIEVYELQKQFSVPEEQYRVRALAVLSADQKVKVGQLEQILKQTPAAYQATHLLLLNPLPPGPPQIFTGSDSLPAIQP
ncbi:MAG: periplasmic heavy metal sensor [Bryobacteraceae bacterium]|nr:periplasmic heavy metal sensor [Bryobacteraceae bacterium]